MRRFFFRVMASIAELERDLIVERTQVELSAARVRGRLGGCKATPKSKVDDAIRLYRSNAGFSLREITEKTGVSKSVLNRHLSKENK